MRARNQEGQVAHKGPNWVLRVYEDRVVDGKVQRVRVPHILCRYSDHPLKGTEKDLEFLRNKFADKIASLLNPVNKEHAITTGAITLGAFIEQSYWSRCEFRVNTPAGNELHMEPSTVEGYRDIYKRHIRPTPIAKMKLADFTPRDGQRFIESLDQNLSHQTHMRIKNFLSGVFSWAIVEGAFRHANNPMNELKAGGRTKGGMNLEGMSDSEKLRKQKIAASNEHAYTLEEVAVMLDKLPEPARTICALSAFTGLSRSELWGLQWKDYDGEKIDVRRKIVNNVVGAPKTEAREDSLYVVPMMRKLLAQYKKDFPQIGEGWVFRGVKGGPLNLDNVSRRDIPQHINGAWFGWHAFRRGLGTRLNEASVDHKTIQSILRHADVSTTMAYYVQPDRAAGERGLRKLSDVLQRKYKIKV